VPPQIPAIYFIFDVASGKLDEQARAMPKKEASTFGKLGEREGTTPEKEARICFLKTRH
jgi:hypothetical protein